jgi:hypothetical protein
MDADAGPALFFCNFQDANIKKVFSFKFKFKFTSVFKDKKLNLRSHKTE